MRGRVVCRWYFTISLGPKSTDPNLEAEAPSVTRMRGGGGEEKKVTRQAPRNSASVLYFCLYSGGPRGLAARVGRLGNRQAERLFSLLLLLLLPPQILYQSCQSGVGQRR